MLLETQGTVSAMTYDNWLSKTEAVCIADDELLVSADSDVTVNVVETRYTELLRECTKKVAPKIRNTNLFRLRKKQIRGRQDIFLWRSLTRTA